jgi:hypothetical protein
MMGNNSLDRLVTNLGNLITVAEEAWELLRDSAEEWDEAYHYTGEKSCQDQRIAYDSCADRLIEAIKKVRND